MNFTPAGYSLLPVVPEIVLAVGAMLLLMLGAYRGQRVTSLVVALAVCLLILTGALELWLPAGKLVVIKVGTSTLMGPDGPDMALIGRLGDVLAAIVNARSRCVLVTSGAVGTGRWRLKLSGRPKSIPEKQAAAAVGQGILMHLYERVLAERGLTSAQLLLTKADLGDRQRYVNASNTLGVLLTANPPVIPIINENDSVAIEELKFGDNDTLSALVASLVHADVLLILSDVDGLYDADPRANPAAKRIELPSASVRV